MHFNGFTIEERKVRRPFSNAVIQLPAGTPAFGRPVLLWMYTTILLMDGSTPAEPNCWAGAALVNGFGRRYAASVIPQQAFHSVAGAGWRQSKHSMPVVAAPSPVELEEESRRSSTPASGRMVLPWTTA